jgi:hypothetical protein
VADGELMVLQLSNGRDMSALVSQNPTCLIVSTSLGQYHIKKESIREVCERLLTLLNRKDCGI